MAEEFCEQCDMSRAFCVHGNPPAKVVLDRLVRTGPTIEAQFNSTFCVGCEERITEGQSITMTHDGWAHTEEVDDPEADTGIFEGVL